MTDQMLTELHEVEQLPDGSIIVWRTGIDSLSEHVAIVIRYPDGSTGLSHSDGRYWLTDVDELNPVPCTVLRHGR
ncbi:hypothetical protein [Nocardia nova]|uniref:hypothetical protein n=1 Tax=Nocardia nova TaxID=37330 RepID=UPI002738E395|nr:hypothetical protein [Nocardia nova]